MVILISAICIWLLGSAFGFGWSVGSLVESGASMTSSLHHSIWMAWPMYKLGYKLGQAYTARQLAPVRMRQKLTQEEMWTVKTNNPYSSITGTATWPTVTLGGGSGTP